LFYNSYYTFYCQIKKKFTNYFDMLKKIKNRISKRKISELKNSPGENIRDAMVSAGIKAVQESAYVTGNNTDAIVLVAKTVNNVIDGGTALAGGTESATALGKILYKTSKDVARGDTVCTGLCVISGTCESVALCCSTFKIIPCRGRIYVGAKIISKGCMSFRNACAGEGC
jgi:hypothetical protein